ncbi:MAG TPA: ferritin-like domain-containing protein [Chroococcales cyanobacterium]
MTATEENDNSVVADLNALLACELSAVQAYQLAIDAVNDRYLIDVLKACLTNHQNRVQRLRQAIDKLGGLPTAESGMIGMLASFVEQAAGTLGNQAALTTLKMGEQFGLQYYLSRIDFKSDRLQSETFDLFHTLLEDQRKTQEQLQDFHYASSI